MSQPEYQPEEAPMREYCADSIEIALLLEQLCERSLADDEDGVAACSALLQQMLMRAPTQH